MLDNYNVTTTGDFSVVMRDVRIASGLTQEELGQEIRKSRRWVSDVERGYTNPSLSSVLAVMRVLGYGLTFSKNVREGEIDLIAIALGEN